VYKILYNVYAGCRSHAHAHDNAIVDARADGPISDQLKYTHILTRTYTLAQANTHTRTHTHTHTARVHKRVHTHTHWHTNTDASPHCHHRPVRDDNYSFLFSVLFFSPFPTVFFSTHFSHHRWPRAFRPPPPANSRTHIVNDAQTTALNFFNMSSWQDYVDKHLLASRCVTKAAIAGHDGNVWAKSDGFDVSINSCRLTYGPFTRGDAIHYIFFLQSKY